MRAIENFVQLMLTLSGVLLVSMLSSASALAPEHTPPSHLDGSTCLTSNSAAPTSPDQLTPRAACHNENACLTTDLATSTFTNQLIASHNRTSHTAPNPYVAVFPFYGIDLDLIAIIPMTESPAAVNLTVAATKSPAAENPTLAVMESPALPDFAAIATMTEFPTFKNLTLAATESPTLTNFAAATCALPTGARVVSNRLPYRPAPNFDNIPRKVIGGPVGLVCCNEECTECHDEAFMCGLPLYIATSCDREVDIHVGLFFFSSFAKFLTVLTFVGCRESILAAALCSHIRTIILIATERQ